MKHRGVVWVEVGRSGGYEVEDEDLVAPFGDGCFIIMFFHGVSYLCSH
jgi:hypothetical protein